MGSNLQLESSGIGEVFMRGLKDSGIQRTDQTVLAYVAACGANCMSGLAGIRRLCALLIYSGGVCAAQTRLFYHLANAC